MISQFTAIHKASKRFLMGQAFKGSLAWSTSGRLGLRMEGLYKRKASVKNMACNQRGKKKKKKKPKEHLVLRWTWINTRTLHPWICQRSVISTKLCLLTFLTRIQSIKAHTRSIESFLCKIHFLTNKYIVLGC